MAQYRIAAVCPTVERADLARQLAKSYKAVWEQHVADLVKSGAENVVADMPPLRFLCMGDDDGTAGWCENAGFDVIRHPEVMPFAKAVNLAAQGLDCEWLCVLNNDLIIQPGFFAALDDMIAGGYEIIGAKLLYPAKSEQEQPTIQHTGKWFSLDFRPFHVLRFRPHDDPQSMQPRPYPCVTFACVAIKKLIWDELKGLDEGYINGYEDDDFNLRAREQGAQIGVHPGMLAFHLESQTSGLDRDNKDLQWLRFKQIWVDTGRIQFPLGMWQGWFQP